MMMRSKSPSAYFRAKSKKSPVTTSSGIRICPLFCYFFALIRLAPFGLPWIFPLWPSDLTSPSVLPGSEGANKTTNKLFFLSPQF